MGREQEVWGEGGGAVGISRCEYVMRADVRMLRGGGTRGRLSSVSSVVAKGHRGVRAQCVGARRKRRLDVGRKRTNMPPRSERDTAWLSAGVVDAC